MEKSTFTREYHCLKTLLRKYRLEAGLTQVQLAKKIGETQSFVSKCERGERRLDLVQLRAFCRAIGIELKVFIGAFESVLSQGRQSS